MTWKTNLFDNLLVVGILTTLAMIIYCKVTNQKLVDLIKSIRELMRDDYE